MDLDAAREREMIETCLGLLEPAMDVVAHAVADAPLSMRGRATLAAKVATYLVGAAALQTKRAGVGVDDHPLAVIAELLCADIVLAIQQAEAVPETSMKLQ